MAFHRALPQSHVAAGRHRARERREVHVGRPRHHEAVLPAEIWNPDTETWTTVDSLQNGRLYHSTALLLPDGRVLMAGGGATSGLERGRPAERRDLLAAVSVQGARPTISSAPVGVHYGSGFDVTTPNAAQIAKVSLIRSPSVTHAFDQNQRFQFLSFTAVQAR